MKKSKLRFVLWKSIQNDDLYIKNCIQAVQELRDNWIGDDSQKQNEPPKVNNSKPTPNYQTWGQCCCFSFYKIAKKITKFHMARLPLEENEWQEASRKAFMLKQRYGIELVESDSEEEREKFEPIESDSEEERE